MIYFTLCKLSNSNANLSLSPFKSLIVHNVRNYGPLDPSAAETLILRKAAKLNQNQN